MSCIYKSRCPSASGWCEGALEPSGKCVPFLLTAYENLLQKTSDILFLCDHRHCGECAHISPCQHTTDPAHAVNFERFGDVFVEKER